MRNIQLVIEYDGSKYSGWQRQPKYPNNATIQGKIEDVLEKMVGQKVELIGAIRTEGGVHAYRQIANFSINCAMKVYEMKHYLNRYLPRDIAVIEALEVPERFHSSFLASSFTYEYKIEMGENQSVFSRKYCYYSFHRLNIGAMKEAAKHFIGKQDFKVFSDNKKMKKSTEREIFSLEIYGDVNEISITICADDFWPYMARIIVGTLLEVGLSNISPHDIPEIIASQNREKAGPVAEAQGLFLLDIKY